MKIIKMTVLFLLIIACFVGSASATNDYAGMVVYSSSSNCILENNGADISATGITFPNVSSRVELDTLGFAVPGQYTPTGLAYDSRDDCLWSMGHLDSKIHKLSKTGHELGYIQLDTNYTDLQGITYDPSTDTLWYINKSSTLTTAYNINKDGTPLSNFVFGFLANDLDWNRDTNNSFFVARDGHSIFEYYTNGTQKRIISTPKKSDGVYYDESDGTLWYTTDPNIITHAYINGTDITSYQSVNHIEGITRDSTDGTFYLASDQWFHSNLYSGDRIYNLYQNCTIIPRNSHSLTSGTILINATVYNTTGQTFLASEHTSTYENVSRIFMYINEGAFRTDIGKVPQYTKGGTVAAGETHWFGLRYQDGHANTILDSTISDNADFVNDGDVGYSLKFGNKHLASGPLNGSINKIIVFDYAISDDTLNSIITNQFSLSNFSVSRASGASPLAIRFNDESYNSTYYAWDFENDGVVDSTEQNPAHTYGQTGVYSVNLTVQNEYGTFSNVKTDYITVEPANITNVSLEVNDLTHDDYAVTPDSIRFKKSNLWSNFTIRPNNQINVTIDRWDVTGDYIKVWNESSETPNTVVEHIIGGFPANTDIQIKRDYINYETVTSNETGYIEWVYDGGFSEFSEHTFSIEIECHDFNASLTSGAYPLTTQFTTSSDGINAYYWDFENDGIIDSTKQNPAHTYGQTGDYSVNLTVHTSEGNVSTVKPDYITVENPTFSDDPLAWFNWVFSYLFGGF